MLTLRRSWVCVILGLVTYQSALFGASVGLMPLLKGIQTVFISMLEFGLWVDALIVPVGMFAFLELGQRR